MTFALSLLFGAWSASAEDERLILDNCIEYISSMDREDCVDANEVLSRLDRALWTTYLWTTHNMSREDIENGSKLESVLVSEQREWIAEISATCDDHLEDLWDRFRCLYRLYKKRTSEYSNLIPEIGDIYERAITEERFDKVASIVSHYSLLSSCSKSKKNIEILNKNVQRNMSKQSMSLKIR